MHSLTNVAARTGAALLLTLATTFPARADEAPVPLPVSNFDRSVAPSVDFHRYASGGWLAHHAIPPDRVSWGAFDELTRRNELRLRELTTASAQTNALIGSEPRKIGDFYAGCTDVSAIERAGISALEPALHAIDALRARSELALLLANANVDGATDASGPVFAFGSEQDPREATREIAALGQGGLSLPTRDYYLANDLRSRLIRTAFVAELHRTFALLGEDRTRSDADAAAVLRLETGFARASKTPDALRDPFANYHPMTLAQVQTLAPHFAWRTYLARSGVAATRTTRIDVGQPAFFSALDLALARVPLSTWQSYLRWHAVAAGGSALP